MTAMRRKKNYVGSEALPTSIKERKTLRACGVPMPVPEYCQAASADLCKSQGAGHPLLSLAIPKQARNSSLSMLRPSLFATFRYLLASK